jgi:hypothetical protein
MWTVVTALVNGNLASIWRNCGKFSGMNGFGTAFLPEEVLLLTQSSQMLLVKSAGIYRVTLRTYIGLHRIFNQLA